jgi:hypothetical protein
VPVTTWWSCEIKLRVRLCAMVAFLVEEMAQEP